MTTLLVTRPQPQADEWVSQLALAGVAAQALPLLAILPPPNPHAVAQAWQKLETYDGLMFVSPAAVQAWMRVAQRDWPAKVWAAAPGPGTARTLRAAGVAEVLAPDAEAEQFDSDALWSALQHRAWAGSRILIVHGGAGREVLAQRWRAAGAQVDAVQAYQRGTVTLNAPQQAVMRNVAAAPSQHTWLFSSGDAVRALPALMQALVPSVDWSSHRALCTHPAIAEPARALGMAQITIVKPLLADIAAAAFAAKG